MGMGFFDYEVALEILGQSKQPLVSALFNEQNRENPDQKLIAFLEQKKAAIDDLMEELDPDDADGEEEQRDLAIAAAIKQVRQTSY